MGSFEIENSEIFMTKIILSATKIFRNLNEEKKKITLYIVILGLIVVPSHFRNLFHNQTTIFFSVLNLRKLLLLLISFSKNTAKNSTFDLTVTFQMIGKRWF